MAERVRGGGVGDNPTTGGDEMMLERRPGSFGESRVADGIVRVIPGCVRHRRRSVGTAPGRRRPRWPGRSSLRWVGPVARWGRGDRRSGRRAARARRGWCGASSASTQSRMLGYCCSSTPRSPYRSYIVHGTTVVASPQPATGSETRVDDGRDDQRRDPVALVLLDRQVGEPGRGETADVIQEGRSRREQLEIPGPAEPLIALRAIAGDRQEIAPHAPQHVVVQPIQLRMR